MSFVVKERCPDCGRTFKNLSNHKVCHSRGSGKHANKLSMVQRQVCPDCGRDFVNLANHKVCHGRGTGIRRTSYPPEAVPWSLAPTLTDINRDQGNTDSMPRPPHDSRHGQTNHWSSPPPTTPPSRSERWTPASPSRPSNRVRQTPAPTPSPSNRETRTMPRPSNRERQTPAPTLPPVQRQGLTPPPTPPSPSRERRTPAPMPGPSQTDRLTPPPAPPFYIPLSFTERLTPPPSPPNLYREEPTPPLYIPLYHGDRRTPSPTAPLYPSIPTFPHHDDNNQHQSRLNQSQAGRHDQHGSYPQEPQLSRRQWEHQQHSQPSEQPQNPFIQREHQQRNHADYRPHLHGRFSGQQSWPGHNSYNGDLSDEDALAVAIAASRNPEEADLGRSFRDEPDINAVPTDSQRLVHEHLSRCIEFGARSISVNRDSIWSSSMAFFKDVCISKTAKRLMVAFTDSEDRREEGVDTGGPRREYLRLLLESIIADSNMLHGDEKQGFLIRPNITAYSKKHFRAMGVMLATIIAQGGQPPAIFAPPVVDAILDKDELPSVDHVPDTRMRESLKRVSEAQDATELQEALEECDWRSDLDGIPSYVTMTSRDEFLRGCVQYFVILQSKPMLDQLIQGLRHCGILELIRRHMLRDLLEYKSDVEVTAERVMDLLRPDERCHSDEQQILDNLSRFLQAAEDGSLCDVLRESQRLTRSLTEFARGITPGRLLAFVTGCSREPAGGFVPKPSIAFNYSATWGLPSAATCSNQIRITVHRNSQEFHSFCQAMMTSMMNGENFTTA